MTIDYSERCLFFGDKRVGLAKKEFDIVELLSQNPGQVFDKERIYERIWGMTARATAALWQSISAGYEQRLRHIQTGYILKQFGGADING